ncbi:MAG TPA: hypothetical protein VH158_04430 [Gemmatimonadales bacterium]|jgi:hypothetical protein|nr:hypothetical protein [Gemmatimonadales bacterium]
MMENEFERRLTDAARDYHRPPATPREEIWRQIEAARLARRQRARALGPRLRWGVGIAALLALGIGIGRWTARPAGPSAPPAAPQPVTSLAYQVVAAQHLSRTEALLTGFRADTRAGEPVAQFAAQARELLATTRLMLDSPAADDRRLRSLLEDLELVLAQIAQLPASGAREDVQLINQGLDQRSVLLRLRTALPAGPAAAGTQGAL